MPKRGADTIAQMIKLSASLLAAAHRKGTFYFAPVLKASAYDDRVALAV